MPTWPARWFEDVTQGRWLVEPLPGYEVMGLCHDTRTLLPGMAYVAIQGENFDGHRFVADAAAKGASLAIVQSPVPNAQIPTLRVRDTVEALQQLAFAHRDALEQGGCKVISVSGSNGKTTTRHLIHHVLTHAGLKGTQSPKSFNNHLGVPLTLLAADPTDDFVACEVGTNHPGEIDALSRIVRPDLAVITSIGEEHLEFFGDLEGVAKEEAAILPYVKGKAWEPPHEGLPLALLPTDFPLLGEHLRESAALAGAVAQALGVGDDRTRQAMSCVEPMPGRMQLLRLGEVQVIHDAYNANPSSMRAALAALGAFSAAGRRVAVLGDMFELGDHAASAHREIAALAEDQADLVIRIGEAFAGEAWSDALPEQLANRLQPGDVVLLKASRGMRLERLIPAIEAKFGPRTG